MPDMKRREFFTLGAKRAAGAAYQAVERLGGGRPKNWIRPPFAVWESEFLHNCTRCDKCITSCPYDVLFALPSDCGAGATGTPAMDLLKKGCHLCLDWPCVAACEPGVLKLPDMDTGADTDTGTGTGTTDGAPLPKIAVARIAEDTCLPYSGPECGACAASCPVPGALTWPDSVKPVIDQDLCTGCALCREACITDPKSINITIFMPRPNDGDAEETPASD